MRACVVEYDADKVYSGPQCGNTVLCLVNGAKGGEQK